MSERISIHPQTPQPRLVEQAVAIVRNGGLIAYPTDSSYAFGCHLGNADAVARIRQIRQLDRRHLFTLVCRDLSDISVYAQVDNQAYRLLRKLTPGAYTFILKASREVPKRLLNERRKTIGIRVPSHTVAQALLAAHGAPLLSTTAHLAGDEHALRDADEVIERVGRRVDAVIDAGACAFEQTSVVDLTGPAPLVVREGAGDVSLFG